MIVAMARAPEFLRQAEADDGEDHRADPRSCPSDPPPHVRWCLPGAFTLPRVKRPSVTGHLTHGLSAKAPTNPTRVVALALTGLKSGERLFCAAFRPGR